MGWLICLGSQEFNHRNFYTKIPSFIMRVLSLNAANASLCVTIKKLWFNSFFKRKKSSCMACAFSLSRLPVGSSANIIAG